MNHSCIWKPAAAVLTSAVMLLTGVGARAEPAAAHRQVTAISADARPVVHDGKAAASLAAPVTAATSEAQPSPVARPPRYRGSSLSYRNVVSTIGLDRGADLTHNPFYGMQLGLQPRFWFGEKVYARASFDVASELTQADWTNDRFYISDLGLGLGADAFYTVPFAGVKASAELALSIPTSEQSRAATRVLATAGSLSLSRKFGKLGIGYDFGADKFWNRHTTGSPTGFLTGACGLSSPSECVDMLVHSGRRNASWSMSHGLNASLQAAPWLGFSLSGGVSTAFLYELQEDERISLRIEDPSNTRYFLSTSASATVKASDALTVALGARSSHAQLAPSGGYRTPFVNRHLQLSLDLKLNLASLIDRLHP